MKTQLPILAGLLLLGVVTYVQGRWSERWAPHEVIGEMAGRISRVPLRIGEWTGADRPMDKSVMQVAGAINSLTRNYRDARDESISLFLLYGRPGQIFVHTPDRCYPAAGFESIESHATERFETSAGIAELGVSTFRKSDRHGGGQQILRVYWGYSADGKWLAPDDLKWEFGGHWGVFKMYVIVPVANIADPSAEESRVHAFVRDMLPELNNALFAPETADDPETGPIPAAAGNPAGKGTPAATGTPATGTPAAGTPAAASPAATTASPADTK